jgi:hypothetical protein
MFRRLVVAVAVLVVLLGACGGGGRQPRPRATTARVVETGFSAREGRLGVATRIRVVGSRSVENIRLTINFLDKNNNFASDTATIPHCPASRDCWWAKSYGQTQLGKPPTTVDGVGVAVARIGAFGGDAPIRELDVGVRGGRARVEAPGDDGAVHVVVLRGRTPRFGWSGAAGEDAITGPRPGAGERAQAFFYPR